MTDLNHIPPGLRAEVDREVSHALDLLLKQAAKYDGQDIVEANVNFTLALLANLPPDQLAASTAMLALRLHRAGPS